jgi:hypothetical protein
VGCFFYSKGTRAVKETGPLVGGRVAQGVQRAGFKGDSGRGSQARSRCRRGDEVVGRRNGTSIDDRSRSVLRTGGSA